MSNSPGDDGPGAEQEKIDTSQANYTSSSSLGADDDLYSSGALGDDYKDYEQGDFFFDDQYQEQDYYDEEADQADTGWTAGDKVPETVVVDGRSGQNYINGKPVSQTEADIERAKKQAFNSILDDPNHPDNKTAIMANEAKINGKDYLNMSSDERQNFYEKGKEYQDNFNRSVESAKEIVELEEYKSVPRETQKKIEEALLSNNKEAQIAAYKEVGKYFGRGENQDQQAMRDVFGRLVGGGNINNVQGIGALNSKEKVEALLSGFNRGSGDPLFGLGGTSMEIDPKTGNITMKTQGSQVGDFLTSMTLGKFLGPASYLVQPDINRLGFENWVQGKVNTGRTSLEFRPGDAVANYLGSKAFGVADKNLGISKCIYSQTNNIPLAIAGSTAIKGMTIDPAINKAMEAVGLDNLNRTIISNEGDGIIKGGGAGTKTNVNVGKSGQTSSIQSDLQAVDETGQDADIDYTTSGFGSNLKSGGGNNNNNNDDGGNNNTDNAEPLKQILKTGADVNTLQNFGNIETPLTTKNNDASLLLETPGFGGRYLTRGRNRNTGSVITRRASQSEIDKDKRRSGILFG